MKSDQRRPTHSFKRHTIVGSQRCAFCHNLWPSADNLVSKYQLCEYCGLIVHSSCKSLSVVCIPCSVSTREREAFSLDHLIKGKLHVTLRQAFDLGGSSSSLLYGVWRYSNHELIRTPTEGATATDCVWSDADRQSAIIALDFSKDVSVELLLELWNSYFEIFDKKLFSSTINIIPAIQHADCALERWFPLTNVSTGHVAQVLLSLRFVCETDLVSEKLVYSTHAHIDTAVRPALSQSTPPHREHRPAVRRDSPTEREHTKTHTETHTETYTDSEGERARAVSLSLALCETERETDSAAVSESVSQSLADHTDVPSLDVSSQYESDASPSHALSHSALDTLSDTHTVRQGSTHTQLSHTTHTETPSISHTTHALPSTPTRPLQSHNTPTQSPSATHTQPATPLTQTLTQSVPHTPSHTLTTPQKPPLPLSHILSDTEKPVTSHATQPPLTTAEPLSARETEREPTQNTQPSLFTQLSQLTQPTEQSTPSRATQPTQASQPIVPTQQLTQPSQPTQAQAQVVQPTPPLHPPTHSTLTQTTQTTQNTQSAQPTETIQLPTQPTQPSQPTQPTQSPEAGAVWWQSVERWGDAALQSLQSLLRAEDSLPSPCDRTARDAPAHVEPMTRDCLGRLKLHIRGVSLLSDVKSNDNRDAASESLSLYCAVAVEGREGVSLSTPVAVRSPHSATTQPAHTTPQWSLDAQFTLALRTQRHAVSVSVVDARTKRRVGVCVLDAQCVSQRNADALLLGSVSSAPTHALPLRDKKGEIVGQLHFTGVFEENWAEFVWRTDEEVRAAPGTPEEVLSMQRLRTHIARFTAIIDLLGALYEDYLALMGWEDPLHTLAALLVFLYFTIHVKAEYFLSGVVAVPLLMMTKAYLRRKYGPSYAQQSAGRDAGTRVYRPVAALRVALLATQRGLTRSAARAAHAAERERERIRERESVCVSETHSERSSLNAHIQRSPSTAPLCVRVSLCAARGASLALSLGAERVVGLLSDAPLNAASQELFSSLLRRAHTHTHSGALCGRDVWLQNIYEPLSLSHTHEDTHHTHHTHNSHNTHNAHTQHTLSLVYPVLQALASHNTTPSHKHKYVPWSECEDSVRCVVVLCEYVDGGGSVCEDVAEVSVSLRDVVRTGRCVSASRESDQCYELETWCEARPLKRRSADNSQFLLSDLDALLYDPHMDMSLSVSLPATSSHDLSPSRSSSSANASSATSLSLLLRVSLSLPDERRTHAPTEEEQRQSALLQQTYRAVDGHLLGSDGSGGGSGGGGGGSGESTSSEASSALSVLWNMRESVRYVQNAMSSLLDQLETAKNLVNWTAPAKTQWVYFALCAVWAVTMYIPSQRIVLLWGLYQFFFVFLPIPQTSDYLVRVKNALSFLPNDDDLQRIYALEREVFRRSEEEQRKRRERESLLRVTLPLHWSGAAWVKSSAGHGGGGGDEWCDGFVALHGRRVVWWRSESDVDAQPPFGQMLLTGLAGTTQVSPVDLKKFGDAHTQLAVFAQDVAGRPTKLSLRFRSATDKLAVEKLVHTLIHSGASH